LRASPIECLAENGEPSGETRDEHQKAEVLTAGS
jgi:hypothetical protein